jgi:hypothetical protein
VELATEKEAGPESWAARVRRRLTPEQQWHGPSRGRTLCRGDRKVAARARSVSDDKAHRYKILACVTTSVGECMILTPPSRNGCGTTNERALGTKILESVWGAAHCERGQPVPA